MKQESVYDKMTRSEKEVAQLLKNLGIKWAYERPIFVWDENKRPRVWAPDFYLTTFGIYVEVCGAKRDTNYSRREKIYKDNKIPIIFVQTYKGSKKWKKYLLSQILNIQTKRQDILFSTLLKNQLDKNFLNKTITK